MCLGRAGCYNDGIKRKTGLEGKTMYYDLNGVWQADIGDKKRYPMQLPGTLDENGIGYPDTGGNQWHPDETLGNAKEGFGKAGPIATRFTRKYTYEGEARLTRRITFAPPEGKRVFLEAERARCLRLLIDGREVPDFVPPSLSTPHIFEVTGLLNGDHEVVLLSDNSYPGLPHDAIAYSSAATDETQTNWNGILGYLRLRTENPVFLSAVRVYPCMDGPDTLTVKLEIAADRPYRGTLQVRSEALAEETAGETIKEIEAAPGITEVVFHGLRLAPDVRRWDEEEGNLYELTAELILEDHGSRDQKTAVFGVRTFCSDKRGRLSWNGRTIFLRSEANCGEFPETGHPPMTVEEWTDVLLRYRSYGINCMRFHSHCPPEAAFTAADRLGMLMQPELSHWNPRDAFESEESCSYYRTELEQIIRSLANHPSFVMLTFGNELATGEKGHEAMNRLLALAHELDTTRLYANGSNVHYGEAGCDPESDFYTSMKYYKEDLRGTSAGSSAGLAGYINQQYPNAMTNYDRTMEHLRRTYRKPVFSFEVGQFEVLPDFRELEAFRGISDPANLRLIREGVRRAGLIGAKEDSSKEWERRVEATGELSRIGYREEIEAAMRTKELSGISLLGLQDFPGQGTALVGMMNSHLEAKPYAFAKPEEFRKFFTDQLPLVLLPRYTWENTQELTAEVVVANYGKQDICGELQYELTISEPGEEEERIFAAGKLTEIRCPVSGLTGAGTLRLSLNKIIRPSRLNLTVKIDKISNTYPLWVYPPVKPVCPENVYETVSFDDKAQEVLKEGGIVYLTPPSEKEALPSSIQAQFTTDFWSVGTFPAQEGGMGQLIDSTHPLFDDFPTEYYSNWQWWPMATRRAVILPKPYEAIITEMDSYAYLRPMAKLLECRCGNGRLLLSSMGLQNLQQYPEARALLNSIYRYLSSEAFEPKQTIEPEVIRALVPPAPDNESGSCRSAF